jgi:hypothetical protein
MLFQVSAALTRKQAGQRRLQRLVRPRSLDATRAQREQL